MIYYWSSQDIVEYCHFQNDSLNNFLLPLTLYRKGLLFRQVASGPHLLQLIYKLGKGRGSGKEVMKLVECEIVNDWGSADQFRHRFQEDLHQSGVSLEVPPNHLAALKLGNTTIVEEDNSLEELEMAQGDAFDLEQRY